jgi:hypothetical protein
MALQFLLLRLKLFGSSPKKEGCGRKTPLAPVQTQHSEFLNNQVIRTKQSIAKQENKRGRQE